MAVPSNNVGFSSIQTEFGGSNPIAISEYYSGGPLVPSGAPAPNGPIPSSGQIAVGQFRAAVSATFMAASGGSVSTSGDYKIHTFTGPGNFSVSSVGNAAGSDSFDYLVVAGGGGAPTGGGGAGGVRESNAPGDWSSSPIASSSAISASVTSYPVSIGGGASKNGSGSGSTGGPISSSGGGKGGSFNQNGATARASLPVPSAKDALACLL